MYVHARGHDRELDYERGEVYEDGAGSGRGHGRADEHERGGGHVKLQGEVKSILTRARHLQEKTALANAHGHAEGERDGSLLLVPLTYWHPLDHPRLHCPIPTRVQMLTQIVRPVQWHLSPTRGARTHAVVPVPVHERADARADRVLHLDTQTPLQQLHTSYHPLIWAKDLATHHGVAHANSTQSLRPHWCASRIRLPRLRYSCRVEERGYSHMYPGME